MNATPLPMIMQRWRIVQEELIPGLGEEWECLTSPLEKLIDALEWVRIEEWAGGDWCGIGRRPHDRGALGAADIKPVSRQRQWGKVRRAASDLMGHGNSRKSRTFHTGLNAQVVLSRRGLRNWRHGPATWSRGRLAFRIQHIVAKMAGRLSRHLFKTRRRINSAKV